MYCQYQYDSSYHYYYEHYYVVIETTHSGIVYGMQSSHKYFGHNWCRILQQPNCVHKTGLIKNKNANFSGWSNDLCPSDLNQYVDKKASYGC